MDKIDQLYEWLTQQPAPHADRALAAALPAAEPEYIVRLAGALLKRENATAWGALVVHRDRLPSDAREAVFARRDLLYAGIARAAQWSSPLARKSALECLAQHPRGKLAYLIPDALRDGSTEVRDAGAAAFRAMAAQFLDRATPPPDGLSWQAFHDGETRQFIEVVWNVFSHLDRHFHVNAFEATLWFARYFDADLWDALEAPRSHAGYVVREHLPAWDEPRLAGFLLLALRRSNWRRLAAHALQRFRTRQEFEALLEHTELLNDEEIARQVHLLKDPGWQPWLKLSHADWSAAIAPRVARWMATSRGGDELGVATLSDWIGHGSATHRRSAILALAAQGGASAQRVLARLAAAGDDANAHFASWAVVGRQSGMAAKSSDARHRPSASPAPPRISASSVQHQIHPAWQALQRFGETEDLQALIDDDRDEWRVWVQRLLESTDDRDRVTALRVVERADLFELFRANVHAATRDAAPGVRNIALRIERNAASAAKPSQTDRHLVKPVPAARTGE